MFKTKGLYASGMVLQRNTCNCIFGEADAGSEIKMSFRNAEYCSKTDSNGNWKIEFNPGAEGGPFVLELTCTEGTDLKKSETSENSNITFTDIFVGEVWVNSGQSNAQLPMERLKFSYKEEMELPENPHIRMITVPISYAFDTEKDSVENPVWKAASPETLGSFSGTAYFFAKKLQEDLQLPIGIINASQGGSPISAWMNEQSLSELNKTDYLKRIKDCRTSGFIQSKLEDIHQKQEKWNNLINSSDKGTSEQWENLSYQKLDESWTECLIPNDFQISKEAAIVWFKKEINLSAKEVAQFNSKKTRIWLGTIMDADRVWVNGTFVGVTYYTYPPRRYEIPAGILKEGKNTITVRVQKNGANPIRFYKEKPYCIFTDDVYVHPVAYRNVENPELNSNKIATPDSSANGCKIDLSGNWRMKIGCTVEKHPGEVFFEWEPTALFNAMLAPAFNHAVAGALWYQGESDSLIFDQYKDLLVKMIGLWRQKFIYAPKNMPFIVMQLPNWNDGNTGHSDFSDWAEMRSVQNQAVESIENAAISVTIDAGEWNDLHPEKKRTGGTRAAMQALRIAYGKNYKKSPVFEKIEKKNNNLIITFKCDSELNAYVVENERVNFSKKQTEIYGFECLSHQKTLQKVVARLLNKTQVVVTLSEPTDNLVELRYLWASNPDVINLYSAEKIPAQGFKVSLK